LYAATEQFEDALIRSGNSEREFRRFTRSYKSEIWPNDYKGIDEANARITKIKRSILSIRETLTSLN
jgi:hypothetical protein